MSNPTLDLTKQLINAQSVTPEDAGCQALMAERLEKLGFNIQHLPFADEHGEVLNFWAKRGNAKPCFVFAGHTDVVPAGNLDKWDSPPFEATIKDNRLYGRGAADMKTSLAAFITATEAFIAENPAHQGSIGFLITSDEEGPAQCGTKKVVAHLTEQQESFEYCLVGEPSSTNTLGDVIKNGRRGSLGGKLMIHGKQGHIAYPHLAENPIHLCGDIISALTSIEWDNGNQYFPPTSFQISNFNSGTGASNVIPGEAEIIFNFRFSTEITAQQIQQIVESKLDELGVNYDCEWSLYGEPFLTPEGELVNACRDAIKSVLDIETELSTSGGTSDGRFIAPTGAQVVELGPINASIHQVNENIPLDTPEKLSLLYKKILENLLG